MSVLRCMNFSVVILVVYMIAIYSLLTSNLVVFFFFVQSFTMANQLLDRWVHCFMSG